jgi:mono/diheme cytochrome c family protein
MNRKLLVLLVVSLSLIALVACGGGSNSPTDTTAEEPAPVGDAANGEALFAQPVIGANNAPGCITCHSLEPDVVIVGPSQAGLATRAETRVPGQSAEDYIRTSITEPNAYVVEGFVEGLMYQNYATDLTPEEIDDLVAYTLTLE